MSTIDSLDLIPSGLLLELDDLAMAPVAGLDGLDGDLAIDSLRIRLQEHVGARVARELIEEALA